MRTRILLVMLLVMVALLAACGGGSSSDSAAPAPAAGGPDAAKGKVLFNQPVLAGNAGCATCHTLEVGKVLVGPSFAGLATRAGSAVPGLSAEEYLRQSITDPNAHLAAGCTATDLAVPCNPDIMLKDWGTKLTPEQMNDIIAYLMTLK
ncbi:MAG: cytochrome c [Caldilineales bacterium]